MSDQHPHGPPSVSPEKVKLIVRALVAACVVVFFLDATYHKHTHYDWEFFGFHGIFGFSCYVGLVLLAKEWRKVVMRDEEYYDRD